MNSHDGSGSHYVVRTTFPLVFCFWFTAAVADTGLAQESAQHGDIEMGVLLDATEQSGNALATVHIHAGRELVWRLITSCAEALTLVPGLVACDILETAPDGSWQRVRHVLNYSWYVPKLTYEIRVAYDKPRGLRLERTAGDLKRLNVSWTLNGDGADTIVRYKVELEPGFWVPRWMVRGALKRDLPKMLRALRTRAESLQHP